MLNAALDPFDREQLTPSQMVKAFHIVRANVLVDSLTAFERHDKALASREQVFFSGNDIPEAVLFISHRWNSPSHPDPTGKQFAAVKFFLEEIRRLCSTKAFRSEKGGLAFLQSGRAKAQARLDAVLSHGAFQATYFLGAYSSFSPKGGDRSLATLNGDVLRKIGVWYDYTSMPQDAAAQAELVTALSRIHELLGASNFISLRHPDDGYDSRAWCAAEVATDVDVERSRFRKICLRLDKIGQRFSPDILREQPAHLAGIADVTLDQLRRARTGADAARSISSFIKMVGVDAEDDRPFPLFFVKRKPWLFRGQQEFLTRVQDLLANASDLDLERSKNSAKFSLGFDVAAAVTGAAKSVGLSTSNEADLPYTALLILYARHRGQPSTAKLFGEALQRNIHGAPTVLARFRHVYRSANRGDGLDVRILDGCNFQFQDEFSAPDNFQEKGTYGMPTNIGLPPGEERDNVLWHVPPGVQDIPAGDYTGYVEWGVAPNMDPSKGAQMTRAVLYLTDGRSETEKRPVDVTRLVTAVPLKFDFK